MIDIKGPGKKLCINIPIQFVSLIPRRSFGGTIMMARSTMVTQTEVPIKTLDDCDFPLRFAAVVYLAKNSDRSGLARFVQAMKQANIHVGGLLQEKIAIGGTGMNRVEAIDIATENRFSINQPTLEQWQNRDCSLDTLTLTETAAVLRRAIEDRVELMVVEKFGNAERDGEGLSDEILCAIAAGIPVLVAVPDTSLEIWNDRTGGMGGVLNCEEDDLFHWWTSIQPLHQIQAIG
ncbi:MAG: DUF2478 domain-containing protein [Rhodospirillaceae bacterium]|nr:DUF2478 domain-containing protein [Rhodospirillales bacterium]MBT4701017.1 DUF2478 domain-containing protein [Rhodospirillaceae bacterium]MBT7485936.1 DUF2478 domain-containing protein [Rhodospirillales bacterium]MBT7770516.1 DUF2478 domain-containing protein [Rhodospirillales bacterium]MBT8001785.1 DUF2478 domain-containing protein [Rhodospirillales bacterium]